MRYHQFGSAIGTLNSIIKQRGNDIWALFYRGIAKSMIQSGKFGKLDFIRVQDRIINLTSVTEVNKVSIINYAMALTTKFEEGGQEALELVIGNANSKSMVRLAAYETRAVLWLQRSKWSNAQNDFFEILKFPNLTESEISMTKHGLAIVTHRAVENKNGLQKSINLFAQVTPSDEVSCSKGVALMISGQFEDAAAEFLNSQSLKQSQFNLSLLHYRRGHFAACIKQLNQLTKEDSFLADLTHLLKARIFLIRQEEQQAMESLKKVNSTLYQAECLVTHGVLQYEKRIFQSAFEYFRKASEQGDQYGSYGAAVILLRQHRYMEARQYLENAAPICAKLNAEGTLFALDGQVRKALDCFENAGEVDKTSHLTFYNMALLYKQHHYYLGMT